MNKLNRGFTLIELLVVIAIIAVFSGVILSQLNVARGRGADAAIKSNLGSLINRAIFYYETNGDSYFALCADGRFQSIISAAGASGNCSNWSNGYRVRAKLQQQNQFGASSGIDWLCIDETGNTKLYDNDPGPGLSDCP